MPRVSALDVEGLPDAMTTGDYTFTIGVIPGVADSTPLIIKCQQAVYPGMSQQSIEVPLHGHMVKQRGMKVMPRTLSISYIETVDMGTHNIFESWFEQVVGSESGTSAGYTQDYAVDGAQVALYDQTGATVKIAQFVRLIPQEKPDIQLDGSNPALMIVTVNFDYSRWFPTDIVLR